MAEFTPITAAEMRKIEQDAIASGRVTGLELMERAGQGVVEAIFEEWPGLQVSDWGASPRRPLVARTNGASTDDPPEYFDQKENKKAVVLCGPGNNGGDGFVVARLLAERGWQCHVSLFGDPDKLPSDAAANCSRWMEIGDVACSVDYEDPWEWRDEALTISNHVFIDALFGIGLKRPIAGILQACTGYVAESRRGWFSRIVSIDTPSGLDADTGAILGHAEHDEAVAEMQNSGRTFIGTFKAFTADLTVTFHRPKMGHLARHGPWMCGKLVVKDIGL